MSFGDVLYGLYAGTKSYVSPVQFRNIVAARAGFDGYQQQDSQEALSVILDTMHEDINRIT